MIHFRINDQWRICFIWKDEDATDVEIMESKASLEVQSLEAAAKTVENMVGPDIWLGFSEQTRSFLATAEQVYAELTEQEENPDYSLVGMELCKALEVELNRKIVELFTEYLNGNDSAYFRTQT